MAPRRGRWLAGLAGLSCLPATAWAHSPIEGLSSFYNGVLHPALVPAHLIAVLGLGLLLGRQAPAVVRPAVIAFLGATIVGLAALASGGAWSLDVALLAGATLVGVLAAADRRLPVAFACALAGVLGLGVGLDSAPAAADAVAWWLALAGNALGLALLVTLGLWLAETCSHAAWQRTATRVVGSWIAASAFMVLALGLAGVGSDGSAVPRTAATPSDNRPAAPDTRPERAAAELPRVPSQRTTGGADT